MRVADLDYALPEDLIAQAPAPERDGARLLVLPRDGTVRHAAVRDLPGELGTGDVLIVNDTRVVPARVRARRPTGGRLEVLFVRAVTGAGEWETLVRGSPRPGERVHFPGAAGEWIAPLGDGRWRVRMELDEPVLAWLERVGDVPLPPYVRRPSGPDAGDRARYQTVYARVPGAVAAPTAGLHLTDALFAALRARGVRVAPLTLHVGPGTFMPLRCDDVDGHAMASEPYDIPAETADAIASARRVVAVGTTTVRALESAAAAGAVRPDRKSVV